jgi:hypothetical protein
MMFVMLKSCGLVGPAADVADQHRAFRAQVEMLMMTGA